MNCPNCGDVLIENQTDSRQEWDWIYYHCQRCQKSFLRTVTRQPQSEMVESDRLEEIEDNDT